MHEYQKISARELAEVIRLRNWCEVEARPKHQRGVAAISKMILNEKKRQQKLK